MVGDYKMAITVRQAIPGTLGRLAVMAGEARGRQLQAGRDIQFTQMALAAQDRAAAMRVAASDRAFAMQQAAATQRARQQPVTPDTRARQQRLRQFVSEAEAADIYDPAQIKQMQIFATLGDEAAIRSIAGKLPRPIPAVKPTARQKELMRQSRAVSNITQQTMGSFQQELEDINRQISARYEGADTQQWVEEHPEVIPEKDRKRFQELFTRRRELFVQASQIAQQSEQTQQRLQLGFTVPEQEYQRLRRLSKKQQAKIVAVQRIEKRNQRQIERKIAVEERQLRLDPYADPTKENTRINAVKKRIEKLEGDLKASYRREDEALGVAPGVRQITSDEEDARYDDLIMETGGDPAAIRQLYQERYGE